MAYFKLNSIILYSTLTRVFNTIVTMTNLLQLLFMAPLIWAYPQDITQQTITLIGMMKCSSYCRREELSHMNQSILVRV